MRTLSVCYALLLLVCSCVPDNANYSGRENDPSMIDRPYVVLVSLDGFRYDYAEKYGAKNLQKLMQKGVGATSLTPVFPSATAPNHYTLVTGMYPANHGIVTNNFYNRETGQIFSTHEEETGKNGSWFGGTPLWSLAEQQGMIAATCYWFGSDVEIQGYYPSYYFEYTKGMPEEERVDQVVDWLKLPPAKRPHFIGAYFQTADATAHKHGPESEKERAAVQKVDAMMGDLMTKLEALNLPINLIIVSDHGMIEVSDDVIYFEKEADFSQLTATITRPLSMVYGEEKDSLLLQATYERLKSRENHFEVFWKEDLPEYLHFSKSDRIGDIVAIAEPGYVFSRWGYPKKTGAHGFDPTKCPEMGGIFYAYGPAFRKGLEVPAFENIHVYPLVTEILGLKAPVGIDGRLSEVDTVLVSQKDPVLTER